MQADPSAQQRLLDVQELDSRLDRLSHRLATLPQDAELRALGEQRADTAGLAADLRIRVDDLTREQKKADADVEQVKSRRRRDQERMDKGLVSNPKDLARMQQELVSLDRRIAHLEDTELEVLEQLETDQRELDELQRRLADLDERLATTTRDRDRSAARLNRELAEVGEQRGQVAAELPEDLRTVYARLREQKGGVAAAALRARRCGGCRLELNPAELGRIAKAPPEEVVRCEECSRILVRTPESGL